MEWFPMAESWWADAVGRHVLLECCLEHLCLQRVALAALSDLDFAPKSHKAKHYTHLLGKQLQQG
jgi:hypothetical protein